MAPLHASTLRLVSQHPSLRVKLVRREPALVRATFMAQQPGDYQLSAPGATFAAKLAASDKEAYINVPKDAGIITAITTQEFAKGVATARHELWPWHVLTAITANMYDDGGLTGYATDIIPLPQTLGTTIADAEATGFFAGAAEHKRISTLAAALGTHAAAQRAAGNAAPYLLDDTKVHLPGGRCTAR